MQKRNMMRKIKFRAWVVDEYKEDENTPKTFKMHQWNNYFFSDVSPVTGWSDYFPEHDDPCVFLMQYTGLKDKNGKEMYEGDIVKNIVLQDEEFDFGIVVFDAYAFSLQVSANFLPALYQVDEKVIEVIGNIYENPKLLRSIK